MKVREITAHQLAMETGKFMSKAQHAPLVVRVEKGPALVIRPVSDDDLAEQLLLASPRFRASIRQARRNFAAGKGIPLKKVIDLLCKTGKK